MPIHRGRKRSKKQRDTMRSVSDLKGKKAEKYVDTHKDLSAAWKEIQENPEGKQGSYWIQRMGGEISKEAFGEAHRGESKRLFEGTYLGGTKVKKERTVGDPGGQHEVLPESKEYAEMFGRGGKDGMRKAEGGYVAVTNEKDKKDKKVVEEKKDKKDDRYTSLLDKLDEWQDKYDDRMSSLLATITNLSNPNQPQQTQITPGYGLEATNIVKSQLGDIDTKRSMLTNLAARADPAGQKVVDPATGQVYANPAAARIAGITNWVYWYKYLENKPGSASMFAGLTTPEGVTV